MSKAHWIHEGAFYGDNGRCAGTYYNNEYGWWYSLHGTNGKMLPARSRLDAIRKIEAAAPTTPPSNPEGA